MLQYICHVLIQKAILSCHFLIKKGLSCLVLTFIIIIFSGREDFYGNIDIIICTSISISVSIIGSNTYLFLTTGRGDFLGISIVGQNFSNGESNLFVGAVIPG